MSEIHSLYNRAGYMTEAVESIGKPQTTDLDGGLGLTSYISEWHCFAYPAENVLAATWNQGLAEKMGELIGEEGLLTGVSGWYAPAMNIHRSPFSGRNYDYYSEDAVLSGKMGAGEARGASAKGMYTFIKHFAINDQETKRSSLSTWVQEQAMREIYLKPFELAVKEGGSTGVMASMNRIGYRFTRGSYALLTTVLREEWGFRGAVITDACQTANEYSDMALAAGIDLQLNTAKNKLTDTKNPVVRNALQKAAKNTCYIVANSLAMNPYVGSVPYKPGFHFFIFSYINVESDLGLCGFLSFLTATALAQTVNFFVQKDLVFKSNTQFSQAVPKYVLLAAVLVLISAALPAYSQTLFAGLGVPQSLSPTLANIVNIFVQVALSYPAMKFWIMPKM